MAAATCTHLDEILDVVPSGPGCVECLATGGRWVHLRRCTECGHVGCCDQSPEPARDRALPRDRAPDHPVVRAGRGLVLVLRRRACVRDPRTATEPVAPVTGTSVATAAAGAVRIPDVRIGTATGRWVVAAAGPRLGRRLPRRHRRERRPARDRQGPRRRPRGSLQWVLTAYLLTLGSLLVLGGSLGDLFGRRRVFLYGLIGFARRVAAVRRRAVGRHPDRGARGRRASRRRCSCPGASRSSRRRSTPTTAVARSARGRGSRGVATAVGPFLGGWLIDSVSWRLVFFINLPLVAVAIVITRPPRARDVRRGRTVAQSTCPARRCSPPVSPAWSTR